MQITNLPYSLVSVYIVYTKLTSLTLGQSTKQDHQLYPNIIQFSSVAIQS